MFTLLLAVSLNASYEMADLKALEKQQSWAELVDHLGDITPSKRDKDWEGLAERGGAAWLGTFDVKKPETAEAPLDALEDGSWKKETEDLSGRCWDDVKGPLTQALAAAKTNAFRRSACPLLAAKNALPAAQKDACDRANQ